MKQLSLLISCVGAIAVLSACKASNAPEPQSAEYVFDSSQIDTHIVDWVEENLSKGHAIEFADPLDGYGTEFVKLALRLGQLDKDYVDAYHGPKFLKDSADKTDVDPNLLANDIDTLYNSVDAHLVDSRLDNVRQAQLLKLLRAMGVRLDVITGKAVSFDTEVLQIYDVEPPVYDMAMFDAVLVEIDALLPGDGPLADQVSDFRSSVVIPKEKLQPIFERAIQECKTRTLAHFPLPAEETFRMEFVTDKSWSGYNYYQGNYESLIQINTDFPILIDRAVDLGCHEGYPGHHVWNVLTERDIVGKRGWIEYSVNPLFGPFGPIAEGSGNYGIKLAFPGDDKMKFEQDVLAPMAGIDPKEIEKLTELNALMQKLSQATNEISRQYLDGKLTREEAIPLIQKYYLQSTEKSAQRVRFVDQYRAYVINYNIGQDWVERYVTAAGDDPDAQWDAFKKLLVTPMTTSDIQDAVEE